MKHSLYSRNGEATNTGPRIFRQLIAPSQRVPSTYIGRTKVAGSHEVSSQGAYATKWLPPGNACRGYLTDGRCSGGSMVREPELLHFPHNWKVKIFIRFNKFLAIIFTNIFSAPSLFLRFFTPIAIFQGEWKCCIFFSCLLSSPSLSFLPVWRYLCPATLCIWRQLSYPVMI